MNDYASLAAGVFAIAALFFPGKRFDGTEWRDDVSTTNGARVQMAQRLLAQNTLTGKTRADLIAIFGNPQYSDDDYLYRLGQDERHSNAFAWGWLNVRFGHDGFVSSYSILKGSNSGLRIDAHFGE